MEVWDWIVLLGTLGLIAGFGAWKTRKQRDLNSYLRGDNEAGWLTIGLGVMATQASAITFLSAPGLGYESGLGFVQFYFGLPIAMVVISAYILPIYYKLKVFTAYEYLEGRFDLKTRLLTAGLFLVQRGLAAGITIFAPSIILSTILGWDLVLTNVVVGLLVILYTVTGGTKAVSLTQKWQMAVIMLGMGVAFAILLDRIGEHTSLGTALKIAGYQGHLKAIDFSWDWDQRYTLWSGLTGGFFLALSYFGTDQSQVQRYLGGRSLKASRLGLLFNGMVKIPMQFFILFIGVLVYLFYLYIQPPVFFNRTALEELRASGYAEQVDDIENRFEGNYHLLQEQRKVLETALELEDPRTINLASHDLHLLEERDRGIRAEVRQLMLQVNPQAQVKDTNYVFLRFVMDHLPHGLIGLLLAVILSAAMSSTSGELNALCSTSMVDGVVRLRSKPLSQRQSLAASRWMTVLWGGLALGFALLARLFDNLIEMVNVLGSLFYGTILGIFLVAFLIKWVRGTAVFYAALVAEAAVLLLHLGQVYRLPLIRDLKVEYLWYNVIGCVLVMVLSLVLQGLFNGAGKFRSNQSGPVG